ncbi:MAG: hypothetical protein P8O22_04805, partial [Akkermansiaceae bacterium]|nr:hypothetical protein [Akkermansiaceae bacterium]
TPLPGHTGLGVFCGRCFQPRSPSERKRGFQPLLWKRKELTKLFYGERSERGEGEVRGLWISTNASKLITPLSPHESPSEHLTQKANS